MNVQEKLVQVSEGVYVEQDALRIAEKINEYDPKLRLKYCAHPDSLVDAPYILVEQCPDGIERIVFQIWELDDRVIERLYAADTQKFDINALLDGTNAKARKDQERRYQDLKDETTEITASIIKTPKDTYKFNDPVTGKRMKIHQHRPVEVEKE